jgi:hypothetical protein
VLFRSVMLLQLANCHTSMMGAYLRAYKLEPFLANALVAAVVCCLFYTVVSKYVGVNNMYALFLLPSACLWTWALRKKQAVELTSAARFVVPEPSLCRP